MRGISRNSCLAVIAGAAACVTLPPPSRGDAAAGQAGTASAAVETSLRSFLQNYDEVLARGHDRTTRYFAALVDLNGDGAPEAIVYLSDGGWCGSGGCTTLILARTDSGFRLVTKVTVTRPPIRVLAGTSHGWHDIAVWVRGGGILKGYEAELRFDGKTYPNNPSMRPALHLAGRVAGRIVVPASQEGTPLYP